MTSLLLLLMLLLRVGIRMDIAVVVIAVLPDELHGVGHRHLVDLWEQFRAISETFYRDDQKNDP